MSDQVRLSINMNAETADALRELQRRHGVTFTEAVRRSISVYKFFDDELANGRKIQTTNARGRKRMDVILPD